MYNVNHGNSTDVLTDYNDWANINLLFQDIMEGNQGSFRHELKATATNSDDNSERPTGLVIEPALYFLEIINSFASNRI